MPPAAAKNPSFGDLSNQSKKEFIERAKRVGAWLEKNLKVPPLFGWFRHHNNNIYPSLERRPRRRPRLRGGRARVGDAPSYPTAPGLSFGLSREHARKREREREREKKERVVLIRKKKRKEGVTKRRVRASSHRSRIMNEMNEDDAQMRVKEHLKLMPRGR